MRRRNFIPGLTRRQSTIVTVGGAVLLGGLLYLALRSGKPRLKPIYDPGEEMATVQGHPFTVRVPRGEYMVPSPDVQALTQVDIGNHTHVVLQTLRSDREPYTIDTMLVERTTNRTHPIQIVAYPAETFVRNRARGALRRAVA